jgi:hypothetical protein
MSLFKGIFNSRKKKLSSEIDDFDFDLGEDGLIEKFSKLSNTHRMGAVMKYGDIGDFKYYPLLRYSIQQDPDIDVKFAALKRIHLFQGHPEVATMLNELNDRINTKALEPYYSMALSKLGIISIEEFKNRMNKS